MIKRKTIYTCICLICCLTSCGTKKNDSTDSDITPQTTSDNTTTPNIISKKIDIFQLNPTDITSMSMMIGGKKVEITDTKKISELYSNLIHLTILPINTNDIILGGFPLNIRVGNKEYSLIIFSNRLGIHGKYYKIVNGSGSSIIDYFR